MVISLLLGALLWIKVYMAALPHVNHWLFAIVLSSKTTV